MAYENNHYVPRFILRQFGEHLNVYNVKDGSLRTGERTDHIFAERKIYPADLEKISGINWNRHLQNFYKINCCPESAEIKSF